MTVVCISILALWFLLSALAQLNFRAMGAVKARDMFSLIPNWSFFAPRPGTFDYHLVFRDLGSAGEFSKWQEIPLAEERTLWGAMWNPEKRSKKVLSDVVQSLVRLAQDKSIRDYSLAIPYLVILNYISSFPRKMATLQTQFMILRSDGFFSQQDPQFIFRSNMHML